jgi:hypothetical protein
MKRFSAALVCAVLACAIVAGGCGTAAREKKRTPENALWEFEEGQNFSLLFYGTASAATDTPLNFQMQAEVRALAIARVIELTDTAVHIRLTLEERELVLEATQTLVQRELMKMLVLPERGTAADVWFEAQTGRVLRTQYKGVRYECSPNLANFASLIAFPDFTAITRPYPSVQIALPIGTSQAVFIARGPGPEPGIMTNALKLTSEDGRGAKGDITTFQAYRLQPGRIIAAWGKADFDTRTSLPGLGLKVLVPLAWHVEYVCRYTKL